MDTYADGSDQVCSRFQQSHVRPRDNEHLHCPCLYVFVVRLPLLEHLVHRSSNVVDRGVLISCCMWYHTVVPGTSSNVQTTNYPVAQFSGKIGE